MQIDLIGLRHRGADMFRGLLREYHAFFFYATRFASVGAETTLLNVPELYRYKMDLIQTAGVWRRGSVIGCWLLGLTAAH